LASIKIKQHNIVGHKKTGSCELHYDAYKIGNDAFWSLLSILVASAFTKLSYEHVRLLLVNMGENLNCVTNTVLSFTNQILIK